MSLFVFFLVKYLEKLVLKTYQKTKNIFKLNRLGISDFNGVVFVIQLLQAEDLLKLISSIANNWIKRNCKCKFCSSARFLLNLPKSRSTNLNFSSQSRQKHNCCSVHACPSQSRVFRAERFCPGWKFPLLLKSSFGMSWGWLFPWWIKCSR